MRFKSLFAAMLVSSVSSIAMAQIYSNVISFGDSLSDNGNFGAGAPAGTVNGRFSNGPTSVEILAGNIKPQAGPNGTMYNFGQAAQSVAGNNVNYAFGGAYAAMGGLAPPIPMQLGLFTAHGGTIGANSLVTLQGGANDIFNLGPAGIAPAATQMGVTMNTLGAMGTKNLLVSNLPDLGGTPYFASIGQVAAGTAMTNGYNAMLLAQVNAARAANPTMNIIYVDSQKVVNAVLANPAAFGFTNTTSMCIATLTCVGSVRDQYFFWDGVHPTAAAHRIFAAVQQQMAQYGNLSTGVSSLAESALAMRQSNISRSFDRIAYGNFSAKGDMRLDAIVDLHKGNGYTGHLEGAQLSYARQGANMAYGGALAAQFGATKQGLLSYQSTSLSMDAWASRKFGATFVNVAAGASYNSISDYKREAGIGNFAATASPSGNSKGIAVQVGQGIKAGNVTYTPSSTLSVINAKVEGYSESGIVAPLAISTRSLTAVTLAGDLRAEMPITALLSGHGLVGYQHLLSVSGNSITATLADQPVRAYTMSLDKIAGSGVYIGAGVGGKTASGLGVSLDYRASFVNGASHKLTGGVKLAF
jgi:outer membrane lipase/esterase